MREGIEGEACPFLFIWCEAKMSLDWQQILQINAGRNQQTNKIYLKHILRGHFQVAPTNRESQFKQERCQNDSRFAAITKVKKWNKCSWGQSLKNFDIVVMPPNKPSRWLEVASIGTYIVLHDTVIYDAVVL